jgi:hypothetical protein
MPAITMRASRAMVKTTTKEAPGIGIMSPYLPISPASLRSDLDRNRRNTDRFHPLSLIDITGIRT